MASNFGIKVSDGSNVKNCNDLNLIMSSKFNMLKIKQSGSANIDPIPHHLSYTPIFFTSLRASYKGVVGSIIGDDFLSVCDKTNLTVNLPASFTFQFENIKYNIFYQQGL